MFSAPLLRLGRYFERPLSECVLHCLAPESLLLLLLSKAPAIQLPHPGGTLTIRLKRIAKVIELAIEISDRLKKSPIEQASVEIDKAADAVRLICSTGDTISLGTMSDAHEAVGTLGKYAAIFEHLPTLVARLPALLSGVVIPIVHYVSGISNSRRMEAMSRLLAQIEVHRYNDRRSTLDAAAITALQALRNPSPAAARIELRSLAFKLLELRIRAMRDCELALTQRPDALPGFYFTRKGRLDDALRLIAPAAELIGEINLSLFLHHAIGVATDEIQGFIDIVLLNDRMSIDAILMQVEQLGADFEGSPDAQAFIRQMKEGFEAYRQFVTQLSQTPAVPRREGLRTWFARIVRSLTSDLRRVRKRLLPRRSVPLLPDSKGLTS
jgi:hypothetical protein